MKKIIAISLLALTFVCTQALATVVTERRIYKEDSSSQTQSVQTTQTDSVQQPAVVTRDQKRAQAIKNCLPYTEHLDSDYLGMNMSFDLRILGLQIHLY